LIPSDTEDGPLSWKSTHRARDRDGSLESLERQQSIVLEMLRAAAGRPVSYEQLRDAGVEFPASVVSELELAGVQVERCRERVGGTRQVVGVRLYEVPPAARSFDRPASRARPHLATCADGVPETLSMPTISIPRVSLARAVFLAAPVTMAVLVLWALVASGPGGGAAHTRGPAPRTHTRELAARAHGPAHGDRLAARRASAAAPARPAASGTPISAALAAQLEARGHELLGEERYGQAIPVLRRALAATGESLASCLQPAGEPCLTYAYALYDLGRALLSSGAAAAAVGVLEHRLQIENQQPVVAAELESARRRLG
jgi:hypothetical protein